jgi:hypothetical protein
MGKPARTPSMEPETVIVEIKEDKYPVVAATQTTPHLALWAGQPGLTMGTQTTFYCDWCKRWHLHGGEPLDEDWESHRVAHCHKSTPFDKYGYYLKNINFVPGLDDSRQRLQYIINKEYLELEWLFSDDYGSMYETDAPGDRFVLRTPYQTAKRIDKVLVSPENFRNPEDYQSPNARTIFKLSQRYRWAPADIMRWIAKNPTRYHPWRTVVKHIAKICPEYQDLSFELSKP